MKHVQSENADETHMEFTHQLCYGATPEESYGLRHIIIFPNPVKGCQLGLLLTIVAHMVIEICKYNFHVASRVQN